MNRNVGNIEKHAIDFFDAITIFDGDFLTILDDRFDYEEQRYISFGLLKGRVIAVTHAERGSKTRLISARRATQNERIEVFKRLFN